MHQNIMGPEWATSLLLEGNDRFATGRSVHPHQGTDRRTTLTGGQNPFAVVIACSDSRVAPEIVFDRGIGDLFVIRTAGNVVDDIAIGSIEYAVAHLGVSLVMVLGHSNCGAVKAVVGGGEAEGHIGSIVDEIAPALETVRSESDAGSDVDEVEVRKENVRQVVKKLETCEPILSTAVSDGSLQVVGAYYDMPSGRVKAVV